MRPRLSPELREAEMTTATASHLGWPDKPPRLRRPQTVKTIRDDAYTHGYVDALQHLTTTLLLAAELDARASRDFGRGIAHAARIAGREALDLVKSGLTLTEPQEDWHGS